MKKILIVEDDQNILRGLKETFAAEHFDVLVETDGEKGYQAARRTTFDVLILDNMLPSMNGVEICRKLRAEGIHSPIILLTSKDSEVDKVMGLEAGADDYVTKPFSVHELTARVRAVMRRQTTDANDLKGRPSDDVNFDLLRQDARLGSHYTILEKLGGGGMGVVYKAEDTRLKRFVALKFLPPELTRDPEAKARFIREAQTASSLQHPNICTIHDIDEAEDGRLFICMDLYSGETLKQRIARGPLPISEAIETTIQVTKGLEAAHKAGMVHRDVKPANIFITTDGTVKILDFGLAKFPGQTALTKTGTSMGTAAYMSPEQARAEQVDHRSDVWSLGVVLYEMIAGRSPFQGEYEHAVMYSILNAEPVPLTGLRTGVPLEMDRIVKKALSKHPRDRYQHVEEMAVDLRSIDKTSEPKVGQARSSARTSPNLTRKLVYAGAAVLVVLAIAAWILFVLAGRTQTIHSIAVLPLTALSDSTGQEYFVDGMTEALIADLSQISALRVISRTSIMRYKSTTKPLPEIARELGVDAVIEGSVLRSGDRVRVTAQLIRAASDEHLWAKSYERSLTDIFALQSEIARAIADEVRIKLTTQQQTSLSSGRKVIPAAHDAYLMGRYLNNQGTPNSLRKAFEFYQQAVKIDSTFAEGYAAIGFVQVLMGFLRITPWTESVSIAKAAVQKALELDDAIAEAHMVLGSIELYFNWNWPAAAKELQRALELGPNNAMTHHAYADYLLAMGRVGESLDEVKLGKQYDPLSPLAITVVAGHLGFARHFDEEIEECRRMLQLDPNFPTARTFMRDALWAKGALEESMAEYRTTWGKDSAYATALNRGYARSGPKGAMGEMARTLAAQQPSASVSPLAVAGFYARAGDADGAIRWLNKSVEQRIPTILHLTADPDYDFIRSDPRFKEVMRRIGFPEETGQK